MRKTILLGTGGVQTLGIKAQMSARILIGVLFVTQALLYFIRENNSIYEYALMIIMFLFGVSALVFAGVNFSRSSKFSPKVILDDDKIDLKSSLFKKGRSIAWDNIKSIQFLPYRIDFKRNGTVETFAYECTPDTSIDIKETIREMAEQKDIEVSGG